MHENKTLKNIHVVAAVIFRTCADDGTSEILATQRGYGDFKGCWEFPGGKIEAGETARQALAREIREELAVEISVGERIVTVDYDYPTFHLTMECFACSLPVQASGTQEITLLEHESAMWLSRETLRSVDWLPADVEVLDAISAMLA